MIDISNLIFISCAFLTIPTIYYGLYLRYKEKEEITILFVIMIGFLFTIMLSLKLPGSGMNGHTYYYPFYFTI